MTGGILRGRSAKLPLGGGVRLGVAATALVVGGLALGACSSSSSAQDDAGVDPGACAAPGGAVAGAADVHCVDDGGEVVQAVAAASCNGTMDMDGGMVMPEYGAPLFNAAGDDDDCKYHVTWSSTPVCANDDVTFTVTITKKADGTPATGADPNADISLTETHLAPNTNPTTTEVSPGTYTIGPVRFDASGRWTVRFHLYESCTDALADSPHGHVAFYADVP